MHNIDARRPVENRKQNYPPAGMNIKVDGGAESEIHFLLLPLEVRRRILVLLLQTAVEEPFPPQRPDGTVTVIRSWLCQPTDLSSTGSTAVAEGKGYGSKRNVYVDIPLVCRQIYQEVRSLPFQVNSVRLRSPYGTNVSATMQFLDKMTSFQLSAIRSLELDLIANPTDSWRLGKILRTVGHASDKLRWGRSESSHDRQSGLRTLKLRITTNDLLMPESVSMSGLQHFLTIRLALAKSQGDHVDPSHESWMVDGLVCLGALEMIDIEMKMSSVAATRMLPWHRSVFKERIRRLVPETCIVQVTWNQQQKQEPCLKAYEWTDIFWDKSCLLGRVEV